MKNNNPRIKRHFSVVAHGPDLVELRHGVWNTISFTLNDQGGQGKLFSLLSSMDGGLSPKELSKREGVSRSDVESLLDHLIQLDVVEFGPGSAFDYYLDHLAAPMRPMYKELAPPSQGPLLLGDSELTHSIADLIGKSLPDLAVEQLDPADPTLRILNDPDNAWLMDSLAVEKNMESFDHWRGRLVIVAEKVVNPLKFQTLNRISRHIGFPWIHAVVDGPQLLIGPTFMPPHTACYECFETRVLMNLREGESYVAYKKALAQGAVTLGPQPVEPSLKGLLSAHTAMEALNFLLTGSTFTRSKVLGIYLPTMEFVFHEVLKVPDCSGCGDRTAAAETELYFDLRTLIDGADDAKSQ